MVTETGALVEGKPSNSYRNILRAGFELDYERANYLRTLQSWSAPDAYAGSAPSVAPGG